MKNTMNPVRSVFFLLFAGLMVTAGCTTTRKTAVSPPPAASLLPGPATDSVTVLTHSEESVIREKVAANHLSFRTFSAKAKIDFENHEGGQQGITAYVRIQKDSAIWISVRPLLGIELMRLLITPDSVKIIDYFKKTVYLRPLNYLQQLINIPYDFQTLQDLIIGNPVYFSDSIQDIKTTPSIISFTCTGKDYINRFDVFADDYLLQENKLMDRDTLHRRSCDLTYGDYKTVSGKQFASRRKIFVVDKNVTQILIDFNRVDFDLPLSFPFAISSKYSVQ